MNVSILGTGYVGLTTGACLAFLGHKVTCADADERKIASARSAARCRFTSRIWPSSSRKRAAISNSRPTTRQAIPGAQVIFIAVGTPPGPNGAPDLNYLQAAARGIGEHLAGEFAVVVNKSTVPIGSGNWVGSLVREAFEQRTGARRRAVSRWRPTRSFCAKASALHDSLYPDRVVIGADEQQTAEVLYTLYRPILDQTFQPPSFLPRPEELGAVPLISTDLASAELIKYAANAFLALKISYINEIGQLVGKSGRGYRAGGQGHRPRRAHRHAIPASRHRLGRLVLRQGHGRAGRDGGRVRPGNADRASRRAR